MTHTDKMQIAKYERRAQKVQRETCTVEQLSLRREAKLVAWERALSALCVDFCDAYVEFREFEAVMVSQWFEKPEAYDAEMHELFKRLGSSYLAIAAKVSVMCDFAEKDQLNVEKIDNVRSLYMAMVSVEIMNKGPSPDHMKTLAAEADKESVVPTPATSF